MSLETCRKQFSTCQKNIAKLQADKGWLSLKAVAASKQKQDELAVANCPKSASVIGTKERESLRHESDQSKALVEVAHRWCGERSVKGG
jgi:hypothetical protein